MADTVETPLGHVSKKTALIGGVVIVVGGALLYRYEKQKQAAANAGANTGIDPATGYAYGSAEDAAALANQAAYVSPVGGSVGSGNGLVGSIPSGGTGLPQGFGSNAAWSQYVLGYFQSNGLTADNGVALSAALGVYLAGQVPTADQQSLITQSIAIAGYPPVQGVNGYPPYINTGAGTPPPPSGGTNPPPGGSNNPPPPPAPWTTHTTVHEGEHLSEVLAYGSGMSQAEFETHNPGISSYYRWYIPGKGYQPGPGNGAIIALNVGADKVVVVKDQGW